MMVYFIKAAPDSMASHDKGRVVNGELLGSQVLFTENQIR